MDEDLGSDTEFVAISEPKPVREFKWEISIVTSVNLEVEFETETLEDVGAKLGSASNSGSFKLGSGVGAGDVEFDTDDDLVAFMLVEFWMSLSIGRCQTR